MRLSNAKKLCSVGERGESLSDEATNEVTWGYPSLMTWRVPTIDVSKIELIFKDCCQETKPGQVSDLKIFYSRS